MADPTAPGATFSSMIRLGEASSPTRADVMAVVLAAAAAGTFSRLKVLHYQGDETEYAQHVTHHTSHITHQKSHITNRVYAACITIAAVVLTAHRVTRVDAWQTTANRLQRS